MYCLNSSKKFCFTLSSPLAISLVWCLFHVFLFPNSSILVLSSQNCSDKNRKLNQILCLRLLSSRLIFFIYFLFSRECFIQQLFCFFFQILHTLIPAFLKPDPSFSANSLFLYCSVPMNSHACFFFSLNISEDPLHFAYSLKLSCLFQYFSFSLSINSPLALVPFVLQSNFIHEVLILYSYTFSLQRIIGLSLYSLHPLAKRAFTKSFFFFSPLSQFCTSSVG